MPTWNLDISQGWNQIIAGTTYKALQKIEYNEQHNLLHLQASRGCATQVARLDGPEMFFGLLCCMVW